MLSEGEVHLPRRMQPLQRQGSQEARMQEVHCAQKPNTVVSARQAYNGAREPAYDKRLASQKEDAECKASTSKVQPLGEARAQDTEDEDGMSDFS